MNRVQLINCYICHVEGRMNTLDENAVPSGWARITWETRFSPACLTAQSTWKAIICDDCRARAWTAFNDLAIRGASAPPQEGK